MDRKQKIIKIGVFGLLLVVLLTTSGYLMYQMTKKQPVTQQPQKNEVTESISQKETTPEAIFIPEDITKTDLHNGWILLTNSDLGYSMEYPNSWLFDDSQYLDKSYPLHFRNLNPEDYPLWKGIYRQLPDNYLEFSVSQYYEGSITNDGKILNSKDPEANKYFYEHFESDNPLSNDARDKISPVEMVINGSLAKKIYHKMDGMNVEYLIPTPGFSKIYVLAMTYKEPSVISEFEHMLNSFMILK